MKMHLYSRQSIQRTLQALTRGEVMKLNKKELNKIENQMKTIHRGDTWTGFRPVIFNEGTFNKKVSRQESKKICKEYCEEGE